MGIVRLLPILLVISGYSWAASVCEILTHRLDLNGKRVEVTGHLGGGTYTGFFIYQKELFAPCEYRWIFSWPSALALWSEGGNVEKVWPVVEKYLGEPVDITVKGRLFTQSDYYVINLPWRPQRPFGRYSLGGVAGTIVLSDIKLSSTKR